MKKNLIALVAALSLMLTLIPCASAAANGNNPYEQLLTQGTVISGRGVLKDLNFGTDGADTVYLDYQPNEDVLSVTLSIYENSVNDASLLEKIILNPKDNYQAVKINAQKFKGTADLHFVIKNADITGVRFDKAPADDAEKKEHVKEVGYLDFGYISPELSSADTYPDYIKEEVDAAVERVQSVQNRESVTFGFMTDPHYGPSFNHDVRMQRATNAYREIANKVYCDKLIINGDFCNDGTKEFKIDAYRGLRNFMMEFNYYPTNGNHDVNSIWDEYLQIEPVADRLSEDELYTLFFNHLPQNGAVFNEKDKGLYYYLDDEVNNLRYIFLDTNDVPDSHATIWKQYDCMSQAQVDWFINEALAVSKDTGVVVISHQAIYPSKLEVQAQDNLAALNAILDAYKTGTSVSQTFGSDDFAINVNADFSSRERGDLIALIAGHNHTDRYEQSAQGVQYIYRRNFMMYGNKRIDGTESELVFDIVTIRPDIRTLYFTRVGYGNDLEVKY